MDYNFLKKQRFAQKTLTEFVDEIQSFYGELINVSETEYRLSEIFRKIIQNNVVLCDIYPEKYWYYDIGIKKDRIRYGEQSLIFPNWFLELSDEQERTE